jgi:hypothetical protein
MLARSIPAPHRPHVLVIAELFAALAAVCVIAPEMSVPERAAAVALYLIAATLLIRGVRFSHDIALVLLSITCIAAAVLVIISAIGALAPPVPVRTYLLGLAYLVVFAVAGYELRWLWSRQ